jgi:glycosyltransferase involved in cell wall biosynthesis
MTDAQRPLVTIGITTYNRADSYLPHTLDSALAQTYPNLEILVSDNASTDHTEELVRAIDDPRTRYVKHARNIGVTPHFNYCVSQARGAYFLLLHDDDLIDPDFIETCLSAAKDRTDYGLIRTGLRRIDETGQTFREWPNLPDGLSTEEFFRAYFAGGVPMHLCSTLFNTSYLRDVGGFQSPRNLFCDVVPEVILAARYERLDIREPKASFRVHARKNALTGRVRDWCVDARYLLDIILSEMGTDDESLRRDGMHFFMRHCMRYAGFVPRARDRWAAYYIVYRSFDHGTSYLVRRHTAKVTNRLFRRPVRRIKALARHAFHGSRERLAKTAR